LIEQGHHIVEVTPLPKTQPIILSIIRTPAEWRNGLSAKPFSPVKLLAKIKELLD
jgi:hypothetical protein